jgi:alpha-D-ribose 1-methylphosphonate 5-triphosphate synthase subunit PhnG
MSCMLMPPSSELEKGKSRLCHETVMAFHYQVVYCYRQLESASARPIMSVNRQTQHQESIARRKAAMGVLAHATAAEIAAGLKQIALPPHENLREAENGLVMVRGRVGGDGAPFNLGEATVSRAAVRLASGEVGFGYALGRDKDKARLIALCDALVQSRELADAVDTDVIAPLRAVQAAARRQTAAQVAATKVDFYTMVRGEG